MSADSVVIGIFVLLYGALVVVAWRRRLLARLAFREAFRRPRQSALVVAGLMVGTTMVLMSFINSDSMTVSLTQATFQSWGRVDLLVSASGQFFSPDVTTGIANDPRVKGKVRGVQSGVEVLGVVADLDRKLDNPAARLIGFDAATQSDFGSFALVGGRSTTGLDLSPHDVLLTRSLADSLRAQTGDRLQVGADGFGPVEFKVFGIARPEGPGDYGAQPAIFAPLSAMARLTGNGQINVVRVSALGDGQAELDRSKAAAVAVASAVRDMPADVQLQVRTAKADDVTEIENLAAQNKPATFALSSIVILAGIALVINLALALAEERRPHLAVLRALGLNRAGVVITTVIEGGIYSFAAAVIGALPGIAAGWLLVSNAGRWVPEIHEKNATVLFVVSAQTIAISIAIGALATLATLLLASLRTSHMEIASAVRALPDPPHITRSRRLSVAGLIALAFSGSIAVIVGNHSLQLISGACVIVAFGFLLRRRIPGRILATLVGVGVAAWVVAIYSTLSLNDIETGLWATVAAIVFLVASVSMIAAANMRVVERFIPRSLVAQLTRRPQRLALASSALGLVMAMVTFIGVFLASTNPDYHKDTGGYDIAVTSMNASSIDLPPRLASIVDTQMVVSSATYFGPVRSSTSDRGPGPLDWHQQALSLYALSDDQLSLGGLPLTAREARYPNDSSLWRALRGDPKLVVSGTYVPGTTVDLVGVDGPMRLTVVASFRSGFFAGLMGSASAVTPFESSAGGATMLLRLKPGVDPDAFALDVRRSMFPGGVEATTTQDLIDEGGANLRNFASEMELLLIAGLGVGVLSLGVQALRAVVERRRSTGLLRALGFQSSPLVAGVVGESVLAAAAGIVAGLLSGAGVGYLFISMYTGGAVGFPVGTVSFAAAIAIVTAAIVTAGPALTLARTAPARALRLLD